MNREDVKTGIVAGLAGGFILLAVNSMTGYLSGYLYALVPIFWKDMTDTWLLGMFLYNLLAGLLMGIVYSIVKDSIPDEGIMKGINFGFLVWLIGPFLGMYLTYLTFAIPTILVLVWAVANLITYPLAGASIAFVFDHIQSNQTK
ncbi:hypothetical protein ACFLQI_03160 [Candidatus Undinarchaeota archaeon]